MFHREIWGFWFHHRLLSSGGLNCLSNSAVKAQGPRRESTWVSPNWQFGQQLWGFSINLFLSWMSCNHSVSIISQIKKLNQVKSIFFLDYHYHTFLNQETKSVKSGHCCQAEPFSRRENAKLLRRHIHQAGRFLRGKSAVCHGVCQYLPHETWSMTWWNYSLIEAWHHDEITC